MGKEIVIGIPGMWDDKESFAAALAHSQNTYTLEDDKIVSRNGYVPLELDWYVNDPYLARSYELAWQDVPNPEILKRVSSHKHTAYLKCSYQCPEGLYEILKLCRAVLDAGGVAVKVESAGVAFSPETWLAKTEKFDPEMLITAFLRLVNDGEGVFSCGMHNFGLPDVYIHNSFGSANVVGLIFAFCMMQIARPMSISDSDQVQFLGIPELLCARISVFEGYSAESNHFNPYGRFYLERANQTSLLRGGDPQIARIISILRHPLVEYREKGIELLCQTPYSDLKFTPELLVAIESTLNDPEEKVSLKAAFDILERTDWISDLYQPLIRSIDNVQLVAAVLIIEKTSHLPDALPLLHEIAARGRSPGAIFARKIFETSAH